jgi:4'-phosphopantetheinyl transferase EntD
MPIFFQQAINVNTRLGIWKIEEPEEYFSHTVPLQKEVTHPQKRVQHLAGRFLLRYLFPDFPFELIKIADTRKPYLPDEQFHFSISHCGDYAAAIVSRNQRVGIDIEIPVEKIEKIQNKFLSEDELALLTDHRSPFTVHRELLTILWSAKEATFKWYGNSGVDFRKHIQLQQLNTSEKIIKASFHKEFERSLNIHYGQFQHLVLAWVMS